MTLTHSPATYTRASFREYNANKIRQVHWREFEKCILQSYQIMRNGMFKQLEDKTWVIDTTLKILKYNITL